MKKEIQEALTAILKVGSNMLMNTIPEDLDYLELPKSISEKTKIKIIDQAEKWNEINRVRAIELKNSYDIIYQHLKNNKPCQPE